MVRLTDLNTGLQFLREQQMEKPARSRYGDDFAAFDPAGFDECFPTIAPCTYRPPGQPRVLQLPDHGELWSRPWNYNIEGGCLELSITGVRLEYVFQKRIYLSKHRINIDYFLRNRGDISFPYIWSAHPLLQIHDGMSIVLPSHVKEVQIQWSSDPVPGASGDRRPWPYLSGDSGLNYAVVQPAGLRQAVKCFTPALNEGWAEVHYPTTGNRLRWSFDTVKVPYLGLWLCYGGWPAGQEVGHHTLALEPTSVPEDSLERAVEKGIAPEIKPGETATWSLEICLER